MGCKRTRTSSEPRAKPLWYQPVCPHSVQNIVSEILASIFGDIAERQGIDLSTCLELQGSLLSVGVDSPVGEEVLVSHPGSRAPVSELIPEVAVGKSAPLRALKGFLLGVEIAFVGADFIKASKNLEQEIVHVSQLGSDIITLLILCTCEATRKGSSM